MKCSTSFTGVKQPAVHPVFSSSWTKIMNIWTVYTLTVLPNFHFFPCLWQATRTLSRLLKTHFQQSGSAAWGGIGGATMGNPLFLRTKDFLEECKKYWWSAIGREKKTCQGVAFKTLQMMMICKRYFTQCWPPTFTEALSFVAGAGVKPTYEWRTETFGDSIEKSNVT